MGRLTSVVVASIVLAAATLGVAPTPAGAATTNPCKVLTRVEIQTAFGGTVSSGKQGLSTPTSTQCEFQVGANGDRPDGSVIVHLTTARAKSAYAGLTKLRATYGPVDGFPNALYAEQRQVVTVLKGDVLLGVQGNFLVTDPLPIHAHDDKAPLVDLANRALWRV